jgi:hypothetical protein
MFLKIYQWNKPDESKLMDYLIKYNNFGQSYETRIKKLCEKMKLKRQISIDKFF